MCLLLTWYFVRDSEDQLDLSAEEAPFGAIAMPPRSVKATMFMDGGSVWVIVIDRDGQTLNFAFPYNHSTSGSRYPTANHGANHAIEPSAIALKDSNRAKEIVLSLLERYREPNDDGTYGTYLQLAEREPDLASKIVHKVLNPFKQ